MNPEDDAVTIFVKGVNEIDFVSTSNGTGQSDFDKLEKHISDLATDYSNAETSAVCTIIFSPPYSCKESCQMTDEVDRGCVKMVVDVKQTVYCGYSNNLLRLVHDW